MVTGLQIIITLFALFALSRAFIAFRKGSQSIFELFLWIFTWTAIVVVAYYPRITDIIFGFIGFERGIEALVYLSIIFLFYSQYRIYAKLEKVEQEITKIVREVAISNRKKKD